MSDEKTKMSMELSVEEAAGKLRQLADQLEAGEITADGFSQKLQGTTKVKISLKAKENKFSLELKVKSYDVPHFEINSDQESETGDESGAPVEKYKHLKKRMGEDFKAIKKAAKKWELPEKELVERFYTDAKTMTTYPEKGDSMFAPFLEAAEKFHSAYTNSDNEGFFRAVEELGSLKKQSHEQFK